MERQELEKWLEEEQFWDDIMTQDIAAQRKRGNGATKEEQFNKKMKTIPTGSSAGKLKRSKMQRRIGTFHGVIPPSSSPPPSHLTLHSLEIQANSPRSSINLPSSTSKDPLLCPRGPNACYLICLL